MIKQVELGQLASLLTRGSANNCIYFTLFGLCDFTVYVVVVELGLDN